YERIEFTQPQEGDDVYEPPTAPAPAMPFGAPQAQPDGAKPEPAGAPNGNQPGALKPNIVERVGASNVIYDSDGRSIGVRGNKGPDDSGLAGAYASNGDPDDNDDPDDGSLVEARHESHHGCPQGEKGVPGLPGKNFVEARHEHRHPETGRFIPVPPAKPPKRKGGVKQIPQVGLMCKENVDMGDAKVCQACKEISEEGWIPVDEEFLGYSMNAPHHPNCRCKTDYKTVYRGVNIFHQTKSGNPHHHPETGRFVSK